MQNDDLQDPDEIYVLQSAEQIRALAASATHDAFVGLLTIGEGSIAQIAEVIQKTPHSLYHHIDKLLAVGLILEAGERRSGARTEKIYRPVAHLFEADQSNNDPDYLTALADNSRAQHRRAGQAITDAFQKGWVKRKAGEENLVSLQITVPLNEKQRQELVARMNQLVEDFSSGLDADAAAQGHLVTVSLAPLKPIN